MQRDLVLCSSNSVFPIPASLLSSHGLPIPCRTRLQNPLSLSYSSSLSVRLPFTPQIHSHSHIAATEEYTETVDTESGFVEVGYISNVHGLQGESRVRPSTDFPELRFCVPGRRWLKQQFSGNEIIQEVELEEGRSHPGQKSWILKFKGIDTVEQAKQLIGSTLLVRDEEKPDLEEGEFYSRDLIGMRVFLQETGEAVGSVINVLDSGGNDLLQVMLDSSLDVLGLTGKQSPAGSTVSDHVVWVPFVEAIVPIVDTKKREMQITPPKGLLELNLRFDERSKKDRRQIEWKERKKNQRRFIIAKKKLNEMGQKQVCDGMRFLEKAQRNLLAEQIVEVNYDLLQHALQSIKTPVNRWSRTTLVNAIQNGILKTLVVSDNCLGSIDIKEKLNENFSLQEKGLQLVSEGKIAIVLVLNDRNTPVAGGDIVSSDSIDNLTFSCLQTLLSDDQRFIKMEDRNSTPLILVCSAHEVDPLRALFSENDYFSFDIKKVQFLEEEKLPVVSESVEEAKKHKILMKSPWEILQSSIGSGGTLGLLSSDEILNNLNEQGVKYIEIMSTSQRHVSLNPLLLGFVESNGADIGVEFRRDSNDFEEDYNMIFSTDFLKKSTSQIKKLHFQAMPKQSLYVELVEKEWVDVIPSASNSYELYCSIYSSLNSCSFDKVCVVDITE